MYAAQAPLSPVKILRGTNVENGPSSFVFADIFQGIHWIIALAYDFSAITFLTILLLFLIPYYSYILLLG